jgi:hypothetical protein
MKILHWEDQFLATMSYAIETGQVSTTGTALIDPYSVKTNWIKCLQSCAPDRSILVHLPLISRRSILVFIERRQRAGLIYIIISSQTKGWRPRWTLGIARRADGLAFLEGVVTPSKGFLVRAAVTGKRRHRCAKYKTWQRSLLSSAAADAVVLRFTTTALFKLVSFASS